MKKCLISSTVSRQFTLFERGNIEVLKELGYEIHCVANFSDETEEITKLGIIKHNIDIQRSPFSYKNIKAYKQLKNIINSEDFELVHCHSPMGGVLTRLAARKKRKKGFLKVIYTAHGFHFFKGASIVNWLLYYPIEKWLSRYTDCLITINQEDYNIAKKKFKTHNIELVNGIGVDKNKFDFVMSEKEKSELKNSLGLRKDDFVIIYVAELSKRKNQGMLINTLRDAVKENDKLKVLFVGKDSMSGKYQKITEKYSLEKHVKFLGFRSDVPKLMKISDLCISTSRQEGLPVNVMEAMMCNLPIIATNCRGNRDLIKEGKNGFIVEIDDVQELKNKIFFIMQNKIDIKNDMDMYLKTTIKEKMKSLYIKVIQKKIIMLRSTSIKNDSRVLREAKSLVNNGYNVSILGWDRDNFLNDNTTIIEFNGKNIEVKLFKKKAQYAAGMKSIFKLIRFEMWLFYNLKKFKNEVDVIHSCDLDTAIPAKFITKLYKKKLVYDIFDYYIDSHYVPKKLKNIVEKLEINVINNANLTIVCTEQRMEQIRKANPKKCIVIYNTPDLENYSIDKKIIKSNNNKIKVVYVGILQKDRLLIEIGEALKENKEIELHIGGFGEYEKYFEKLSNKYSNIFYYGKMNYGDVLCLENDCDILFATYNPDIKNHKYSAPNKAYEAMAFGKPIIVCNNTGIDKIISKEKIGLLIDYNEKDFLNAIKLISKKQLYKNIKIKAVKLYNNKYNWKLMEKKLNEAYEEI